MMQHQVSDSLHWVKRQLDVSLGEAQRGLEAYVNDPADVDSLVACQTELHQAAGTLKMLELAGPALLASEMEEVVQGVLDGRLGTGEHIYEPMIAAILVLPDYLDQLVLGEPDLPAVLMPQLNGLRGLSGKPPLTDFDLFRICVGQWLERRGPLPQVDERLPEAQAFARQLRPAFQVSLLAWLRGQEPKQQLARLAKVAQKLSQASRGEVSREFWWVAEAFLRDMAARPVDGGGVKPLVGRLERQLKGLIENGETALEAAAAADLKTAMLYELGRSGEPTESAAAVVKAFDLDALVPSVEAVARLRERLSGPNIQVLQSVAAAIREDLIAVKESLDGFMRAGQASAQEVEPLLETLGRVASTLGMLGRPRQQRMVEAQRDVLRQVREGRTTASEEVLFGIAEALLRVEEALDPATLARVAAGEAEEDGDRRQLLSAVLRESVLNLARAKEALLEYLGNPHQRDQAHEAVRQLHEIRASLGMLGLGPAMQVVGTLRDYLRENVLEAGEVPPPEVLDAIADAVINFEAYLEHVQSGRRGAAALLTAAEASLSAAGAARPAPSSDDAPDTAETAPAAEAQTQKRQQPEPSAPDDTEGSAVDDPIDPELVEIFLEEAEEVLATLRENFPRWRDNAGDQEALVVIRRSFHTLKGSGRMVGAERAGDFAWALESMLNRLIDQTIERSSELVAVVEDAIEALPSLIEELRVGERQADIDGIKARAESFGRVASPASSSQPAAQAHPQASGDPASSDDEDVEPAVGESASGAEISVPATESRGAEMRMEPALYEIFARESRHHLAEINRLIEADDWDRDDPIIGDALVRVLHTLNGSANMAGAHGISSVARHLERLAKAMYASGQPLTAEALALLREAGVAIESQLAALGDDSLQMPRHEDLVTRIDRLATELAEAVEEVVEDGAHVDRPAEMDPALTQIFLEEGGELLMQMDETLQIWRESPTDREVTDLLLRQLHTFKGNARMAEARNMADLAHEAETVIKRIGDGRGESDPALGQLIVRVVDQLGVMLDRIRDNAPVYAARSLLDALAEAGGRPGAAQAAHDDAPEPGADNETTAPAEDTADRPGAPEFGEADAESVVPEASSAADAIDRPDASPGPASVDDVGENMAPPAPSIPTLQVVATPAEPVSDAPAPARAPAGGTEQVKVAAELLDGMLNNVGEISIYHGRLEQQVNSLEFNLKELHQTVGRLRRQLRELEIETEAQILYRHQRQAVPDAPVADSDFDPLELDRYTRVQQLSRSLTESVSDLTSLHELLDEQRRETESLLLQQGRVTTEVQESLMRTRMVPLSAYANRLRRIVRQTADALGKPAALSLVGADEELDRNVLERMITPLEHMLRNAVNHGLEPPAERARRGKPAEGLVRLAMRREGSQVIVEVSDDGAGLDLERIRRRALEKGLLSEDAAVGEQDLMQFILEPGFSTMQEVTQIAGRGVGLDVVDAEIKQLGGSLAIDSKPGEGTRFVVRLPYTLAISQALLVDVGEETFSIPLSGVEGVVRLSPQDSRAYLKGELKEYEYAGDLWRLQPLAELVGAALAASAEDEQGFALLLVRSGDIQRAVVVDRLRGSREIVVKSGGPQIASVRGIAGATILGDGRVVMILDLSALIRLGALRPRSEPAARPVIETASPTTVMVVDDSITVRRVTRRLLEKQGMRVLAARDGVEALTLLQDNRPDVMLLDIEMPRMDGFELASHVRNDAELAQLPIIMITSRVGEKHRSRAMEIGVDEYLGKPYQEQDLLDKINALIAPSSQREAVE